MSLINDALKRACEAEQQRAENTPPPAPLQPADPPPRRNWGGWVVLFVLLGATLVFAAIHLGRWAGSSHSSPSNSTVNAKLAPSPTSSQSRTPAAARPAVKVETNLVPRLAPTERAPAPALAVQPVPTADRARSAPPDSSGEATPDPSKKGPAQSGAETVTPATTPAETRFPELKLQSIIFRLRNPSVLIDGEMLGVGGTVKGARVVKIERHAVTVEWQGQTNLLRLPQL